MGSWLDQSGNGLDGLGNNSNSGLRFELDAPHPEDPAVQFKDRPQCPVASSNVQTLQHFFDFTQAS